MQKLTTLGHLRSYKFDVLGELAIQFIAEVTLNFQLHKSSFVLVFSYVCIQVFRSELFVNSPFRYKQFKFRQKPFICQNYVPLKF
jgi:uncharacterized membrane protein